MYEKGTFFNGCSECFQHRVAFFVDQAKETAKKVSDISEEAANQAATKAGEIVGGSARSFGDGLGEGIDKSGNMTLQLSEELSNAGVKLGAHTISSTDDGNDNKLSIYFILIKILRELYL